MPLDEIEAAPDGRQHPETQHVHLEQPERVEIVLVPLDDGAVLHRRVLDRHQLGERPARDHEAADVLRQMPREAEQRACERQHPRKHRARRIEPGLAHAIGLDGGPVPPLHRPRQRLDLQRIEVHRLRHVPQCAARAVADHGGGERGAAAAVLLIDVLDDLLASLVLEVDVDVRRLVALARDEALEEQRHPSGIDLGDPQAETHGRIRRRAAPLAENAERTRIAHDVVHRQEIRIEVELRDQRELALDELRHLRGRAIGPASAHALQGELSQPARRCLALGDDLARVLVAQLLEREAAARSDRERRLDQLGRIDLAQP